MALTNDWSNLRPLGSEAANTIDDEMRTFRLDIAERITSILEGFAAGETEQGKVKQFPFLDQTGSEPGTPTAGIVLYAKDASGQAELRVVDEAGNDVALTAAGVLSDDVIPTTVVRTTGGQTVGGAKTLSDECIFGTLPLLPAATDPTDDRHPVSKAYYDGKNYDSGWFAVDSTTTEYVKTHSLGSTALITQLWFAEDDGGGSPISTIVPVSSYYVSGRDNKMSGGEVSIITTTTLTVRTGKWSVFEGINNVGTRHLVGGSVVKAGHYRVTALRID